jgi:hypothetical protein
VVLCMYPTCSPGGRGGRLFLLLFLFVFPLLFEPYLLFLCKSFEISCHSCHHAQIPL